MVLQPPCSSVLHERSSKPLCVPGGCAHGKFYTINRMLIWHSVEGIGAGKEIHLNSCPWNGGFPK